MGTLRSSAMVLGPAAAAVLLAGGSISVPFYVDAVSFALSAWSFLLLPLSPRRNNPQHATNLRRDWHEAMDILWSNRLFFSFYLLNMGILIFAGAADAQEVVFAQHALHLGRLGYSIMVTVAGAGFIVGSLLTTMLITRISTRWLLGIGSLFGAAGYLIYALAPGLGQAVIGLITLGVFGSLRGVGFTTYRQQAIPISHMGRVNNIVGPLEQMLAIAAIMLGGVLAARWGIRYTMYALTIPQCLLGGIVLWLSSSSRTPKSLRKIDVPL